MSAIVQRLSKLPVDWLVFVALETFAQISLKVAAAGAGAGSGLGSWFSALLFNHWFQVSIAADVINFFIWMSILRRHDLSLAVPLSSLSYFSVILLSTVLLHEPVALIQLLGLGTVGLGIVLIARPDRS